MKTEFDYTSYQQGERYGIQFGLLLSIIIGLTITLSVVFILFILSDLKIA